MARISWGRRALEGAETEGARTEPTQPAAQAQ